MKTTQAWGWLVAGVVAAGLNAAYHDGSLEWVHRAVERATYQSEAVLALASGRVDEFLADARLLRVGSEAARNEAARNEVARNEAASCRLATALARVQAIAARSAARSEAISDRNFDLFETISDREEARLARLEADRVRMEGRLAAQAVRFNVTRTVFNNEVLPLDSPACPRARVTIPWVHVVNVPTIKMPMTKIPAIKIPPAPAIDVGMPAGPV